jgi:uncharacterized protein YcbX
MIKITELNIYPVKSLRGISLNKSTLGVRGLEYDRNWMVTDSNFKFVTQRQIPLMSCITVSLTDEYLILNHPEAFPLTISLSKTLENKVEANVWKDHCQAFDEGEEVSKWLTNVLGLWQDKELKLVRYSNDHIRNVDQKYLKGENSHTAFADGFPFLITSEESLMTVNDKLNSSGYSKIEMNRFRPNIVVKGVDPFEEDKFDTLRVKSSGYELGLRRPCQRCQIPSIDQLTGEIRERTEPLRTLMRLKTQPELTGAFFGQNATLIAGVGDEIKVGDVLESTRK